jgi:F-type H+-transporting ATPase subunit b
MEKEMETVVEKAISMAEDEKTRILKEAEESAEDIKRQAEAAVHAAVVEAKRSLQVEVAEQAAVMAEELIVKNLTPEDQVAITEQYLEKVGAVQ